MNVKLNWPRPRFSVSKEYKVHKSNPSNYQLENDLGEKEHVSKQDCYPTYGVRNINEPGGAAPTNTKI